MTALLYPAGLAALAMALAAARGPTEPQRLMRLEGLARLDDVRPATERPAGEGRAPRRYRGVHGLLRYRLVVAACVGVLVGIGLGSVPGAVAVVSCCAALRWVSAVLRRRHAASTRRALTIGVTTLVAEHRAGARWPVALEHARESVVAENAEVADAFALAARTVDADPVAAARACAGVPGGQPVAVALGVALTSGARAAPVLDTVVTALEAQRELERVVSAQLAGPRASAVVLAGLPILGVALGVAMGADPARVLLHSTAGAVLLLVGCCLDLAGLVCLGRMIRWAER